MNWLRTKLRKWLGIEDQSHNIVSLCEEMVKREQETRLLVSELESFRTALKAKAAQAPQVTKLYTDYESSQTAALRDFEKEN
jgi:hypothetical protein